VFLVETALLCGDRVTLDGPEGRHAATVRRLRAGEQVGLSDGAGRTALCQVVSVGRDSLELDVLELRQEDPPAPRIVVVQALPKGDRGELAVEVMTEAGVDEIVPWAASRCITQWKPDRREKSLARWRNAAREAAKQSRRSWLPEITDLATTPEVTKLLAAAPLAMVLHEEAAEPLSTLTLPAEGPLVLVVGPEGGISPDELGAFTAAGALAVRLGPSVLRTSTAGVAAASVLMARTGRW
jgi:16S rRNA (uracil1498-N3)-methyltransferase